MKKIIIFSFAILTANVCVANQIGHFEIDYSGKSIKLSSLNTSFSELADLPENTNFILFRDTLDEIGIRHQSYQQYVRGIKVESGMVLVHSKNSIIKSISASLLIKEKAPSSTTPQITKRKAASTVSGDISDEKVEHVIFSLAGKYYSAYKIYSPERCSIIYLDTETGELLYEESIFKNADVTTRGYTRYNGWQNMTCFLKDNLYYLIDEGRNIATMSANNKSPNTNYYMGTEYKNTLPDSIRNIINNTSHPNYKDVALEYLYSPMLQDYILNSCTSLYSAADELYMPCLTSVTISSANSSWWYDSWDTQPDLYIKIYDTQGNLLHVTPTKDNCTFPVTFTLSTPIILADVNYYIEIYDEDITSDSYGGKVTISNNTPGTKTWSGTSTTGSILIDAKPSEYADIHWGMQKTIDFYLSYFNRNSFDNNGHVVINIAFPPYDQVVFNTIPNNAAAQNKVEPYFMFYGYGDGLNYNPVVSLDVMAHEYTHLVTTCNGNGGLDYREESGAINESFSDCFAMGAVNYALGVCNWQIGKGVIIGASNIRSMSDPKNSQDANGDTLKGAQPDTYKGECWSRIPTQIDSNQEVVHRNSGVMNYCFYLLSQGGSGTNDNKDYYSVTGIGIEKACQIFYRTLIYYLTPSATFEDARNGSLRAADDLYGATSQEYKSLANAWYAVGVGYQYLEPLKPGKYVVLASTDTCSWFMSSTLTSGSTKRLIADTINAYKDYFYVNPDPDYLWEITQNPNGTYYFKGNGNYLSWNSGNSAAMSLTPKELTVSQADNYDYMVSFPSSATETRYLSLNTNNPYFAFYGNQGQNYKLNFLEAVIADTVTIKAKMPSNWGSTVRAWVWYDGETGYWETPTKEGDWYVYKGMIYDEYTRFNIIFVNGTNWSTDNNQTVDISVSQDMCIQIGSNSGKRTYTNIDCEDKPAANSYYLLARRKTGDYYYLTPTTVSGKDRLVAIDAGDSVRSKIDTVNAPLSYLWTLENATDGVKLKGSSNTYLYTSAAKSAKMDATGFVLKQRSNSDGTYTFYYPKSSTENWYLSLAMSGNDYFVFYANENQFTHILLMKPGKSTPTFTPNSIDNNKEQPKVQKIIRGGQLLILRDGKAYNAQGGEL